MCTSAQPRPAARITLRAKACAPWALVHQPQWMIEGTQKLKQGEKRVIGGQLAFGIPQRVVESLRSLDDWFARPGSCMATLVRESCRGEAPHFALQASESAFLVA